jgi:hypothetical protein
MLRAAVYLNTVLDGSIGIMSAICPGAYDKLPVFICLKTDIFDSIGTRPYFKSRRL